jgi:dienelactone hydrolase
MSSPVLDTVRFARGWLRPPSDLRSRSIMVPVDGDDDAVPATLMERTGPEPSNQGDPPVGWVVLHGITRPGRYHPALLRFARSLASTGGRVLIPEIPEWTRMDLAPQRAQAIIRSAVDHLASAPETAPGGVGLVGFSFGAPQALYTAADPGFTTRIRGVVGWGGYSDLSRTVRFQLTGEFEWEGRSYHLEPDPYGRWIVGANILPLVSGFDETTPVADALRALATEAGDRQIPASDSSFDSLITQLRVGLPRRFRPLFDLFAPPSGRRPPNDEANRLVELMAPAARRELPLVDPLRMIEAIRVPVRLLHSRSDQLIPFTETLAMADALSRRAQDMEVNVTGLFGHSGKGGTGGVVRGARESLGFLRALTSVFEIGRR